MLCSGGLIAHQTSTLAGIAASAQSKQGILKAQRFKQRRGPFLLLADSVSTALKQAVFLTPALRELAKKSWPGSVTLVFSAKRTLAGECYCRGDVAVRVDASLQTRLLAKHCGGFVLSSSLNRKGQDVQKLTHGLKYRWHRHLSSLVPTLKVSKGQPSQMFRVSGNKVTKLR
ncbi:MAG: Sua5/YciO/YrdC/YwlC family protein [Ghiorsea sp.]